MFLTGRPAAWCFLWNALYPDFFVDALYANIFVGHPVHWYFCGTLCILIFLWDTLYPDIFVGHSVSWCVIDNSYLESVQSWFIIMSMFNRFNASPTPPPLRPWFVRNFLYGFQLNGYYFIIHKVVISVCLSDPNSGTHWPVCLKFWLGKSGDFKLRWSTKNGKNS